VYHGASDSNVTDDSGLDCRTPPCDVDVDSEDDDWRTRTATSGTNTSLSGMLRSRTFENQLHPITMVTQDRTPIDHSPQNGGLFAFLVLP